MDPSILHIYFPEKRSFILSSFADIKSKNEFKNTTNLY